MKNETTSQTLDIDLLRTFHAVARLGQFRAAADHVHRSPAAVSVHIQRLEAVAGGRLFERDNQSVSLTPLGQRLLAGSLEVLHAHDRVLGDLHGNRLAGRIRLGLPDEYAVHVIRHILPLFASSWPNVVLEVTTAPSLALREQIDRERLHLALAVQPVAARSSRLTLAMTTPVWVGSPNLGPTLPDPVPLALHVEDCPYRQAMITALEQAGRDWRVVLSSPSSQAVEACVESGLAVSLVDRSRLTSSMQIRQDLPAVPAHEIILLHAASVRAEPAAAVLSQTIQQHFSLQRRIEGGA